MEPVSLLLGAMVWALIAVKAWGTARTEHELAKQGITPPRMQAKWGDQAAAKIAKYGFTDYLRDAYRDFWGRRGDALAAARAAEPARGSTRVRLRDRLAAAWSAVGGTARRVVEAPIVRRLVEPVAPRPKAEPVPAADLPPQLAVDSGDVEEGTRRWTDTGQEEYRGGRWQPVPKISDAPPTRPEPPVPSTGGAMTAPTGEAVNYETTVAELEALAVEQRQHLDACIAAQAALAAAKGHIGDMQDSYRASSAAAASTHEHLAALHLDDVTLANTGTTTDAMPAGAVDNYFEQLELLEAMARERREAAEVALSSTEAALSNIQSRYGDAATTVAGDLSGDSRFLDGGGGGGLSAPVASPAA